MYPERGSDTERFGRKDRPIHNLDPLLGRVWNMQKVLVSTLHWS